MPPRQHDWKTVFFVVACPAVLGPPTGVAARPVTTTFGTELIQYGRNSFALPSGSTADRRCPAPILTVGLAPL